MNESLEPNESPPTPKIIQNLEKAKDDKPGHQQIPIKLFPDTLNVTPEKQDPMNQKEIFEKPDAVNAESLKVLY